MGLCIVDGLITLKSKKVQLISYLTKEFVSASAVASYYFSHSNTLNSLQAKLYVSADISDGRIFALESASLW